MGLYAKRLFIIVGFIVLAIASSFFFLSFRSEHQLRIQKENELGASLAKVNDQELEIANLKKQYAEMEKSLNERIASLEASLKTHEENIRILTDRKEALENEKGALEKEKEALMEDNLEKSHDVSLFDKKIAGLEASRQELLSRIGELESKKTTPPAPENTTEKTKSKGVRGEVRYDTLSSKMDPVKLGKIIVQKSSGHSAQVQQVNEIHQFIIINAGSGDGLKNGSVINVVRGDQIIGKAVIEKLKPNLSAATLLSEWTQEPIEVGDFVTQF